MLKPTLCRELIADNEDRLYIHDDGEQLVGTMTELDRGIVHISYVGYVTGEMVSGIFDRTQWTLVRKELESATSI